jgi:bifunctional DNA-binding transcriptional regulator/antitoxin component of YhaV-PrlF toxin-antitoxin module
MRAHKITTGGQISLPAKIRRRWATKNVIVEDRGDHVVVRPLPDDPIEAVAGAFAGRIGPTEKLRARARADEEAAIRRR